MPRPRMTREEQQALKVFRESTKAMGERIKRARLADRLSFGQLIDLIEENTAATVLRWARSGRGADGITTTTDERAAAE